MPTFEPQTFIPTPEEISRRCAEIRAGWTHAERRRRAVGASWLREIDRIWHPPTIDMSSLRASTGSRLVEP